MNNYLTKLAFSLKKPYLIIVTGKESVLTSEAVFQVLRAHFKVEKIGKINLRPTLSNKVLILISSVQEIPVFFINKAKKAIVVASNDKTVREIKNKGEISCLTFGFQEAAQVRASDFHANKVSTNFKINYQGNVVPVWLENLFEEENARAALAAAACAIKLGLNLVEISQALKNFKGLDNKIELSKDSS